MNERPEKTHKRFKPEEIQHIPAFNYYASKEELVNAIKESDKRLHQSMRESDERFQQSVKEVRADIKNDFRYIVGIMLGGFSIVVTGLITLIVELFLKH
jgi:hypothetical protein